MSIYQIYFSATNHTKAIVNTVTDEFGPSSTIDLSHPSLPNQPDFSENDVCIVGVPSYGGRVPAIALERMKNFNGSGATAVAIVSYGNRDYDDTLVELEEFLTSKGFLCIAGITAVAEHSLLPQFATGRPNDIDKQQLAAFAKDIKTKLSTDKSPLHFEANHPLKEYNGVPLKPIVNNLCTNCKLCASQCPVQAIPLDNPQTTEIEKCISCMKCIYICPNHARTADEKIIQMFSEKLEPICSVKKDNELFL